jgi:hypothetical protein
MAIVNMEIVAAKLCVRSVRQRACEWVNVKWAKIGKVHWEVLVKCEEDCGVA